MAADGATDGASPRLFKTKNVKSAEASEEGNEISVSTSYENNTLGYNGSRGWSGHLPSWGQRQYRHRIAAAAVAPAGDCRPASGAGLPAGGGHSARLPASRHRALPAGPI